MPSCDCEFESLAAGSACRRCGYRLLRSYEVAPKRNCQSRCGHLGAELPPVLIQCESCNGRVMIKHAANVCGIHGSCLPTYVPPDVAAWQALKPLSDNYHLCHGCEKFEAAAPPI